MPRVVVVGGGPAGVRAAETLVQHGCTPVLIDEADKAGGQIYRQRPNGAGADPRAIYGFDAAKARALHSAFERVRSNTDYRPATLAWNVQDGVIHLYADGRLSSEGYDALVLATGATDRVIPLKGWTLPGVYTLGGTQIALKYQACAIGQRTVFIGSTPLLYLIAYQYLAAGAHVAAVLDTGTAARKVSALPAMFANASALARGLYYMAALRARGVPLHASVTEVSIEGASCVERVRFRSKREREIACDAVGMGFHLRCETQLAELAGCDFAFDDETRQWIPVADENGRTGRGVYLAGDGMKIAGADAAEIGGRLAAFALLEDHRLVGADPKRVDALRRMRRRHAAFQSAVLKAFPFPRELVAALGDEVILCRCESVTVGALRAAAANTLDVEDVNRRKAFCRVGMGRCQGRYCGLATAELLAHQKGIDIASAGRLRVQAPVKPIALAAGVEQSADAA
jgi:NADPH-dependent 2,4-dienoyl-CoA reductase/sulfur reductase-like enzyme